MTELESNAPQSGTCPACGASVSKTARFCGVCGSDLSAPVAKDGRRRSKSAASIARRRGLRRETLRPAQAIGVVYVGLLVTMLALPFSGELDPTPSTGLRDESLVVAAILGVGFAAIAVLGKGAWRQSLAGPATSRATLVALAVGAAVLVVNALLLVPLQLAFDQEVDLRPSIPEGWPIVIVAFAVMPALFEEWLCRGVLWTAVRRVSNERTTLVVTSLLFAMLHGLGGGQVLELPTRFLAGLVFGLLRSRSGSLVPAIAAHFVNNLLATLID